MDTEQRVNKAFMFVGDGVLRPVHTFSIEGTERKFSRVTDAPATILNAASGIN